MQGFRRVAWPLVPWIERQVDRSLLAYRALGLLLYDREIAELACELHYRRAASGPLPRPSSLYPFERRAIERFFPPPPARLFVPGCGRGREARALADMGYRIVACEPEAGCARIAAESLKASGHVVLVERVQDWAARGEAACFDGIIAGWGMWTHLLEPDERRVVLKAFRRASFGPLLLSFWRAEPVFDHREAGIQELGRPEVWARRVRERLGRPLPPSIAFCRGFWAHRVSEMGLREEAASAGYAVSYYERDGSIYPHAVLCPKS